MTNTASGAVRLRGALSLVRTSFAGLAVVGVLAGCAADPGPGPSTQARGSIVGRDDTGLPDHPIGHGWIIAADTVGTIVEQLDVEPPDRDHLPNWSAVVDVEELAGPVSLVEVDRKGRFTLERSGSLVLCHVDQQAVLGGCVETVVEPGTVLSLMTGEGGLRIARP